MKSDKYNANYIYYYAVVIDNRLHILYIIIYCIKHYIEIEKLYK